MTVARNLSVVHETIAAACARANRDPASVTLVAVSKTHPESVILEAVAAGLQHFGENRVEEGSTKIPAVNRQTPVSITWHMIGHIQSRKAKDVLPLFQVVHSVDSVKLAEKLSRLATEAGKRLDALVEINVSGEASKSGFPASNWATEPAVRERLWQEVGQVLALPGLNVRGLMTMAPIVEQMEQARPVFAGLAALRQALVSAFQKPLPDLSMGMTDDYPVAIEEGATIVRIGRAIFGERNQ
jgi:pyridoxal phosphate enzyme (YggS family)